MSDLIQGFRMPEIPQVKRPHVQEAESFREGLKLLYESLQRGQQEDEEIAAFYETARDTIRVREIKMAGDSVLILAGKDGSGNLTAVAGHFSSINIIYKKIKLEKEKERIPIGF